jgi:hypothetical protein
MRCSAPEPGDRLQCLCPERTVDAQQTRRMHDKLAVGPVDSNTCIYLPSLPSGDAAEPLQRCGLHVCSGGLPKDHDSWRAVTVCTHGCGAHSIWQGHPIPHGACGPGHVLGSEDGRHTSTMYPLCIHYAYTCTHAVLYPSFLYSLHSLVVGGQQGLRQTVACVLGR